MRKRWAGWLVVVALLGAAGTASAGPDKEKNRQAREHFDKGSTHFNLGRFDDAIDEWSKGYELKPDPVFLFNIGQAQRMKGDFEKALFFYRRYLMNAPDAPNRAAVEQYMADMEESLRKQKEAKEKPPTNALVPDDKPPVDKPPVEKPPVDRPPVETPPVDRPPARVVARASDAGAGTPAATGGGAAATVSGGSQTRRPARVRLDLEVGPEIISLSGLPSDVPTQPAMRLGGAWTLPAGPLLVDLGVALTWTPLPYAGSPDATASLLDVFLRPVARYPLGRRLAVRAEGGIGLLHWAGLAAGNPFTRDPAGGGVTVAAFRLGAGAEYGLPGGLTATLTAFALTYSPTSDALDARLDGILRYEVCVVGLGYAL